MAAVTAPALYLGNSCDRIWGGLRDHAHGTIEGYDIDVCAINVEEVWRGTRPGEEEAIGHLLGALRMAPLGRAEEERAGRWRARFAASGVTLSQADYLIAAAVGVGARLATGNPRDFPMDELEVENWPVG